MYNLKHCLVKQMSPSQDRYGGWRQVGLGKGENHNYVWGDVQALIDALSVGCIHARLVLVCAVAGIPYKVMLPSIQCMAGARLKAICQDCAKAGEGEGNVPSAASA